MNWQVWYPTTLTSLWEKKASYIPVCLLQLGPCAVSAYSHESEPTILRLINLQCAMFLF